MSGLPPAGQAVNQADLCAAMVGELGSHGGGLLLIVGPAGIGKSTLARAAQQQLVPKGALWLWATHPDLEPPLGLWSRLHSVVATHDVPFEADSNDRFTTTVRLLRHLGSRGVTPIVLDDLHAADTDSLTLLAHLAPVLATTGATVIATSRGAGAVIDELGRAAHRALESQARVYEVMPLEVDDVRRRLLHHADGHAVSDAVVQAFWSESGGNPLLLEGLLHDCWPPDGAPPGVADVEVASTGPSVVDRWRRQLESLTPGDRHVLAAAIELGPWSTVSLICDVLTGPTPPAAFDRLAAHGVIAPVAADGLVTLAHPAVAEALTALDGPRPPALHARVAQRLARAGAEPRTVLMHMVKARTLFTSDQRRLTAMDVVHQAERRGDRQAAGEAWDIVVGEGPWSTSDVVNAAMAWQRAGDRKRARDMAWTVARDGDPNDVQALARAALIAADGAEFHGEASAAVALLHRVRALLEPLTTVAARTLLVEVVSALAPLEMTMPVMGPRPPVALDENQLEVVDAVRWHWVTRPQVAQPRAVEAERLARQVGDPVLEATAGLVWRATHMAPDHAVARRRRGEHARGVLIGRAQHARAVHAVLLDALEAGELADMRIALGELADLAAATGDPSVRWRFAYTEAMLEAVAGRPAEAEAASDTAGRYGVVAGEPTAIIVRLEQRTVNGVERLHDVATVLGLAQRLDSVSHPPLLGGVLHLVGGLHRAGFDGADVDRRVLSDLVTHLGSRESREQNWALTLAFAASTVAAVGDVALAHRLLEFVDEVRQYVVRESSGIVCLGHHLGCIGALEILVGDHDAGCASLEAARSWNESAGFARAAMHASVTLLAARRHELSDADLRCGAGALAHDATRRGLHLMAAQVRRLGAGSTPVTLTPRQVSIVEGLVRGETYQQIADGIGYSHGTVRGEITTIYDRLGVDNRDAAVAEAQWLGLVPPSEIHGTASKSS